jgi:hypothetical protein
LIMPFYGEAMHKRNMEMSFFGMPVYILDVCPENRDESNGDSIIKLSLQFIPIFGVLHSQLRKGHTTKKDISMFHEKKDITILFPYSVSQGVSIIKRSIFIWP